MSKSTVPNALVWATDIDVMGIDRVLERRDGYLVVRSPSHPEFYWGNLLLFDEPPAAGDGPRWERWFDAEFEREPRVRASHVLLGPGRRWRSACAREEFVSRGYELEETVGLVATADVVRSHPRENRDVAVRALDLDADDDLWDQVVELQVAARDEHFDEQMHRDFCRQRMADKRALFRAGRGAGSSSSRPRTPPPRSTARAAL